MIWRIGKNRQERINFSWFSFSSVAFLHLCVVSCTGSVVRWRAVNMMAWTSTTTATTKINTLSLRQAGFNIIPQDCNVEGHYLCMLLWEGRKHSCAYVCVFACVFVCLCVCVGLCVCVCVCVCLFVCGTVGGYVCVYLCIRNLSPRNNHSSVILNDQQMPIFSNNDIKWP